MEIKFKVNQDKVLEAIVYVASKEPNIDIYHTVKTMFFADKYHLNRYARPVLGDLYMKMPNGPVPSLVKDIISMSSFLSQDLAEKASKAFSARGKNKNITVKREANLDDFSESDIECLDEALAFCKDKSFQELRDITHEDIAWKNAGINDVMDYGLLIDKENPNHDDILCDLEENSQFMVI